MRAYELMKLAIENPEKYIGKRYKVVDGAVKWNNDTFSEVEISDGGLLDDVLLIGVKDGTKISFIVSFNSCTELEEIELDPKPVTFMEAIRAYWGGKTIYHKYRTDSNHSKYVPQGYGGRLIDAQGLAITASEIMEGDWFIKE